MSWIVKDAIHGVLSFQEPEMCREIIDLPAVQRIRGIKQTGFTYLVFPSAEHSRFQHAIGVAYIAGVIASALNLSKAETKKCEAAGLLHDIGVLPFSHTLEYGDFGRIYRLSHVRNTLKKIRENGEIQSVLHKYSLDPGEICDILAGGHYLTPIISGPLDSDKLDYLQRDSYFTGVRTEIDPYVYHIFKMHRRTGELFVIEKGLPNVEAVFCARYRLTQIAYYHHGVRVASLMLNRAMMDAYARGEISMNELVEIGDEGLLIKLAEAGGYSETFAKRLWKRKLYKRVTHFELGEVDSPINKAFGSTYSAFIEERKNILKLEMFLAKKLNQEEGSILIDIPDPREFEPPERRTRVWLNEWNELPTEELERRIDTQKIYVYHKSSYIANIDNLYRRLRKMWVFSEERLSSDLREKCKEIIAKLAENPKLLEEVMDQEPWIQLRTS